MSAWSALRSQPESAHLKLLLFQFTPRVHYIYLLSECYQEIQEPSSPSLRVSPTSSMVIHDTPHYGPLYLSFLYMTCLPLPVSFTSTVFIVLERLQNITLQSYLL